MNNNQRILALDAALVAAESLVGVPNDLRLAISLLQDEVEKYRLEDVYPVWEQYLNAQKEAVRLLASNPQCFGADPDDDFRG